MVFIKKKMKKHEWWGISSKVEKLEEVNKKIMKLKMRDDQRENKKGKKDVKIEFVLYKIVVHDELLTITICKQ